MRPLIGIIVLGSVLAFTVPVSSQPAVRVVAVADFDDQSTEGALIDAARWNVTLGRFLSEGSKGRLRIAGIPEIRAAMQSHGYSAADLDYPSRAAEVAQAVGADWLITGRWTHVAASRRDIRPSDPMGEPSVADADATINIRVTDAASRKILLEGSFWSAAHGSGAFTVLRWAAEGALQKAAARILDL